MLSFVVRNGRLKRAWKPLPALRRGWALVRVRMTGICKTDLEILRGYHNFHGTPGHEFVGEVAEVEGVDTRTRKKWLEKRVAGGSMSRAARTGTNQLASSADAG